MNRNQQTDFSKIPHINCPRSMFNMIFEHITTGNTGDLIPFYCNPGILPGDTHTFKTAVTVRSTSPFRKPIFGNIWLDIYYFYVPYRQVYEHTNELFGENEDSAWFSSTEYTVPQMQHPTTGVTKGSVANYLGSPIGTKSGTIAAWGIRTYGRIYKYFFRDQNLIAPDEQYIDETTRIMDMNNPNLGGKCYKAAKIHDYFTSALPGPQKGEPIKIPLGSIAPVIYSADGTPAIITEKHVGITGTGTTGQSQFGYGEPPQSVLPAGSSALFNTLLSEADAASVQAVRMAFGLERILERDAMGGTRINEIIESQFGVTVASLQIQQPEYLGGKRIPVVINQITQTSSTTSDQALGELGAQSMTYDVSANFTKSFMEWGTIMGVMCIRQNHIYQQGINRLYFKKRRWDFYWPELAYLGMQPIYNGEIFYQGNETDMETFGFGKRFDEYRYTPSRISGETSSLYAQPLDIWHPGDYYETIPMLGQQFIEETPDYIDRCLTVTSKVADQWLFDIAILDKAIRPIPVNPLPGLIDHY